MRWIFEPLFGARLRGETRYLSDISESTKNASRERAMRALRQLARGEHTAHVADTLWGEPVVLPLEELLNSHSIVEGATGSGKTSFALIPIEALIQSWARCPDFDLRFGVLDLKGDLADGTLYLLKRELDRGGPRAEALYRRITIIDFGAKDPVSPYNLLARWPGTDPDLFAGIRSELILDLLGSDKLSLSGSSVLRHLIALLSVSDLPLTEISNVIHCDDLRRRLFVQCQDRVLAQYFRDRFPHTPLSTLAAIERRIDALLAPESVRLVLSANAAPNFRELQDDGAIVIIKCFGQNLSRDVRRVLEGMVFWDIVQGVFGRLDKSKPFLWVCDESQNLFAASSVRQQVGELVSMARSFRTHFLFLTQNISCALPDSRLLRELVTNIRWSLSLRGEPESASFLRSAMPVTGAKLRPKTQPFDPPSCYTPTEERWLATHRISTLPDRVGYLLLKAHCPEALLIRTRTLDIPSGDKLTAAVDALWKDPGFGRRLSRKEYNELIEKRDHDSRPEAEDSDVSDVLTRAYRRTRTASASSRSDDSRPSKNK